MNFNNYTLKSQEAIQEAIELVQSNGQQVIETLQLFRDLLTKGE
jgi:ATP-dependent Clp protease ATP-binding subunit ClpB